MKTGFIERVEETEDGRVGWGSFEDGQTFDLPLPPMNEEWGEYGVGTEVMIAEAPEGESYDQCIVLAGQTEGVMLFCESTDEGMKIIGVERIERKAH